MLTNPNIKGMKKDKYNKNWEIVKLLERTYNKMSIKKLMTLESFSRKIALKKAIWRRITIALRLRRLNNI